jgi:hypothetical protein
MIPSWPAALLLFGISVGFFTWLGLPFARMLAPRTVPALALAPSLGWAGFSVLSLPILSATGFSTAACGGVAVIAAGLAGWVWRRHRVAAISLPAWSFTMAVGFGLIPLMAIMPKAASDGFFLAPPLFDHVKIAVVDAILRNGLPVPNPFYGPGGRGVFAYYYLWHFSVALVARLSGAAGWTAEAAMTGFTATASILLVLGLVRAWGGRALALASAGLLCLPGSVRPVLAVLAGTTGTNPFIPRKSDIGGWLNQAAWVPQHLAAACCVVVAGLLMLRLAEGGFAAAVALGLVVAAGFESSIWVGGFSFAVSGTLLGLWLLWHLPADRRRLYVASSFPALLILVRLIAPFVAEEQHLVALRQLGPAVAVLPYPTFGNLVPAALRGLLDLPGFWLVMLPFAFPALVPLAAFAACRPRLLRLAPDRRPLAMVCLLVAAGSLGTAWLLRSVIENNDLGWRAVLPALLVLPAVAGCVVENLAASRAKALVGFALLALLGVPETATMLREYAAGVRPGTPQIFAATAPAWAALRAASGPLDRVAGNPSLAAASLFWPVNPAWALLSDRPSCYAGRQSVVAYGAVTQGQLAGIDARFARVFDGQPAAGDVAALAGIDDCAFALVTARDGAWHQDAFATAWYYAPIATGKDWRLYKRIHKD